MPLTRSGEPRAFFGRRSGKALHAGQAGLMRDVLPGLLVPAEGPIEPKHLFAGARRFEIEVGFGGGEHLARRAAENPDTGFFGCEVFSSGIAKLVQQVDAVGLANIRIHDDDAIKLLARLPEACLDAAFLLYPDPWPKTRHHKRRFVSPLTLSALARVLRPGASLHVATDIEDYADWTLAHVLRAPGFSWPVQAPGAWHEPFPGWQPTRYEQKARREGRIRSFYFSFLRA